MDVTPLRALLRSVITKERLFRTPVCSPVMDTGKVRQKVEFNEGWGFIKTTRERGEGGSGCM